MQPALTAVEIPCCLCGTLIAPNAANQCATCLAQECDLAGRLQRGPAGGPTIDVHQCRQCRRFQQTPKYYVDAEPESPELLAVCLKHIPALSSTTAPKLHLVDASFIWTEPNSMRLKVRLTVRTTYNEVPVQQRVAVEVHVKWQQCPDCNREFTNRTWMAVVQLRQKTEDSKRGLANLEMALRKAPAIRKHVLNIDAARNGFDFYFLTLQHAQAFTQFLAKLQPMRTKTSQKLISTDTRNSTAHLKHTVTCDVVPMLRDDLILIRRAAKGTPLAGRLALVERVSSVLKLLDASPKRSGDDHADWLTELSAETYYRSEKEFHVLLRSARLTRFVVLDVELICKDACQHPEGNDDNNPLYQGPDSGVSKYALADVVIARASEFGVNDNVISVVTHLGHLLQAGDSVLGYDLETAIGGDWDLENGLPSSYSTPEVVLVKKIKDVEKKQGDADNAAEDDTAAAMGKRVSKKKQRRRRKEGKKMRELEESAVRMGFLGADIEDEVDAPTTADFDNHLEQDPELAQELAILEEKFNALDTKKGGTTQNTDSDEPLPLEES